MPKIFTGLFAFLLSFSNVFSQGEIQKFVTTDINNFWTAYYKIISAKDSVQQYDYLNKLYIEKGSEGLKNLMQVRRYTAKDFIDAINAYSGFWQSIRENTFKSKQLTGKIGNRVEQLRQIYPDLKPSTIYFAIGAFKTNGTILNNDVVIGCEMALADKAVNASGLPKNLQYFCTTFTPFNDIELLCTHEYVHTQQKKLVDNLLSYCLYEGVAEFVSVKTTGIAAYSPAIMFRKANEESVAGKFEEDMFQVGKTNDWLWSAKENVFKERDLGYYIGYAICEKNYELAKDKKAAIKEMIELDFTNDMQVENFVDRKNSFPLL